MRALSRTGKHPSQGNAPSLRIGMLARLLLLLGLLVGLFAMHGLGVDHDMAMTGAHSATSAASAADALGPSGRQSGTALADAPLARYVTPADAPGSDQMSDMAQACVAILAGAALLALLLLSPLRALLFRWLAISQPDGQSRSRALPPLRPPDLSVLCVLRT